MLTTALLLVALLPGQLPAEKPPQSPPAKPPVQAPAAPVPAPAKPPVQAPAAPAAPAAPRPAAPTVRPTITVLVTDRQGKPIPNVTVKGTGPLEREGTSDSEGTVLLRNLSAGTYRLRFEHASFITFEREVAVAARPQRLTAELSPAPPPPPSPPAPAPPPAPVAPPPPPVRPSGPPTSLDIANFYEKNAIGRGAAAKNSSVGCTGTATATLIQLRDSIAEHSHADADEMLYIVAGSGVAKVGGTDINLTNSTFAVIPRGTPHTLTHRGGPIMLVLSILTGPPCEPGK